MFNREELAIIQKMAADQIRAVNNETMMDGIDPNKDAATVLKVSKLAFIISKIVNEIG